MRKGLILTIRYHVRFKLRKKHTAIMEAVSRVALTILTGLATR